MLLRLEIFPDQTNLPGCDLSQRQDDLSIIRLHKGFSPLEQLFGPLSYKHDKGEAVGYPIKAIF